jgi:uncharacterized membrane protein
VSALLLQKGLIYLYTSYTDMCINIHVHKRLFMIIYTYTCIYTYIKAPVTALLLQKGLIEIEVWDKNSTRADVLIGEGSGLLGDVTV